MEVTTTIDSRGSSKALITELLYSFLHQIATRPRIIPYTDMVKWVLDSADIKNRQFKTQSQELIGLFTPQNLRFIYPLKKWARGENYHQERLNWEMEEISDAWLVLSANFTSFGKTPWEGKPLITQSPVSLKNCRKSAKS